MRYFNISLFRPIPETEAPSPEPSPLIPGGVHVPGSIENLDKFGLRIPHSAQDAESDIKLLTVDPHHFIGREIFKFFFA
eukprot:SAG11_NODE_13367_length_658_cov_1.121646_1_plen_78_part_10